VQQARLLYRLVQESNALEPLCGPPPLSIVPFRHVDSREDLDVHNTRLVRTLQDDGRVWLAPATVDGHVGLRPCFVNYRTTDDDVRALVDVVVELGAG
jgi:aromatic-L-amino-acid decarboxylase